MAEVVFRKSGQGMSLHFNRMGSRLPRKPQLNSMKMLQPIPGPEGVWPKGVDRKTPGWISKK